MVNEDRGAPGPKRSLSVAQNKERESQVLAAHQITFNQHIVMPNSNKEHVGSYQA